MVILCGKCGGETMLGAGVPDCWGNGRMERVQECRKCGRRYFRGMGGGGAVSGVGRRIWFGWWISQLNSAFVDPKIDIEDVR